MRLKLWIVPCSAYICPQKQIGGVPWLPYFQSFHKYKVVVLEVVFMGMKAMSLYGNFTFHHLVGWPEDAHLNHLMEFYSKKNYSWIKTSLAVGLQLGYNVIFGSYASFLLIRTGHLLAP
ncbi:uncharacterized protein LOC132186098 isoform X3 [Corylus avellana]|uniref:uncharacterized protein LOC132186098 isoform X3 n=1 Tax=Corylus avellana TaxID=13451 RepID=UPI00286A214A|nr:uncharacterized protein LOC132186098 isoform X3 [Corylus avellana]